MLTKLQIFMEPPYPEAIGGISYNMSELLQRESLKKCTWGPLFRLEDNIYHRISPTSFDMYDFVEEDLRGQYNGGDVFAGDAPRRGGLLLT